MIYNETERTRWIAPVRMLEKGTDRFEDPSDKRVTGESGSLANEPCVPVGQANRGGDDWGR